MDWIFDECRNKATGDIYSARSWLLVAKCIFPRNFQVLFEAYKLEKSEKNIEQCAELIGNMFKDFPDEYLLNKELELMVMKQSSDKDMQQLSSLIFDSLQSELQRNILLYIAERQADINLQCKLTLMATQKLPEDMMKFGLALTEKLVNGEKLESSNSPLNKYRKLLICDVLPVICDSAAGELSHKQYYKWLQKAIEFFVAIHTTSPELCLDAVGKVSVRWSDLEALRAKIGRQCNWEPFPESNLSLGDRMKFIKEMHRLSRTDVSGTINKRQIFYTSLFLLFESSIKFSKLIDPAFCNPKSSSMSNTYVLFLQPMPKQDADTPSPLLSNLKESLYDCFNVARTSWLILQSNESFSKDINHLVKRWKMDRWVWFQLFLSLHHILENDYKTCTLRLNRLLEQNWSEQYRHVNVRCLAILASVYHITDDSSLACRCIIECLSKLQLFPQQNAINGFESIDFCDTVEGSSLVLTPLNVSHLLPYWVYVLVTSLSRNTMLHSCSDDTLGHLLVLTQHRWPKWKDLCGNVLNIISSRKTFHYPIFCDYVVVGDILEEISLLWNTGGGKSITLYQGNFTNQQRVTRGVNKGTAEEFSNAITAQMNKGEEGLEGMLVEFLLKQEHSIMDCLCMAAGTVGP